LVLSQDSLAFGFIFDFDFGFGELRETISLDLTRVRLVFGTKPWFLLFVEL
jgi:hypothetical protein